LTEVRGTVINIHYHGATVRLEDGTLAAVSGAELAENRPAYVASLQRRTPLTLALDGRGRHPLVALPRTFHVEATEPALPLSDQAFEARMDEYLKSTHEWAPPDRPPPAERHFIRKKRRARIFEARNTST